MFVFFQVANKTRDLKMKTAVFSVLLLLTLYQGIHCVYLYMHDINIFFQYTVYFFFLTWKNYNKNNETISPA